MSTDPANSVRIWASCQRPSFLPSTDENDPGLTFPDSPGSTFTTSPVVRGTRVSFCDQVQDEPPVDPEETQAWQLCHRVITNTLAAAPTPGRAISRNYRTALSVAGRDIAHNNLVMIRYQGDNQVRIFMATELCTTSLVLTECSGEMRLQERRVVRLPYHVPFYALTPACVAHFQAQTALRLANFFPPSNHQPRLATGNVALTTSHLSLSSHLPPSTNNYRQNPDIRDARRPTVDVPAPAGTVEVALYRSTDTDGRILCSELKGGGSRATVTLAFRRCIDPLRMSYLVGADHTASLTGSTIQQKLFMKALSEACRDIACSPQSIWRSLTLCNTVRPLSALQDNDTFCAFVFAAWTYDFPFRLRHFTPPDSHTWDPPSNDGNGIVAALHGVELCLRFVFGNHFLHVVDATVQRIQEEDWLRFKASYILHELESALASIFSALASTSPTGDTGQPVNYLATYSVVTLFSDTLRAIVPSYDRERRCPREPATKKKAAALPPSVPKAPKYKATKNAFSRSPVQQSSTPQSGAPPAVVSTHLAYCMRNVASVLIPKTKTGCPRGASCSMVHYVRTQFSGDSLRAWWSPFKANNLAAWSAKGASFLAYIATLEAVIAAEK